MRPKSRTMHMRILLLLCALFGAWLSFAPSANAQQLGLTFLSGGCGTANLANVNIPYLTVNNSGQLCDAATVSVSGFAPGNAYAHFTSGATSTDNALPTGAVIAAFNTGTSAISCELSVGAGTATANENVIQPGNWFAFTVGSNTHIACINQAGDSASNVVVLSGGSGIPTGGGLNGVLGTQADAAWTSGSGSLIAIAKAIANNTGAPVPLGTAGGWTTKVCAGSLSCAALNATVQAIKTSAGQLGKVQCDNNNAAWTYIQIFNATTGNVTLGTTAPAGIVPLAPSLSGGFALSLVGDQYSTAISVAATTTATGSTAPGTAINCQFSYN